MTGTSGFKGSGITDPFQTPDAPTVDSVSAGVLSADVTISAPADTGGAAIDSYVVTAKQGDGTSVAQTASAAGTVSLTLTAGGTTTFAAQALNKYGAGQFSGFSNSTTVFSGQELYSWGYNGDGQLGLNDTVSRSSPVQVGSLTDWSKLNGGLQTSVGVKTDGTLWAWGINLFGQLGHNDTVYKSSPVQVGALTNWSDVQAGQQHCLALKTDGTLWAWGNNGAGRLGINTNQAVDVSSPVQVGSLTSWSYIAAGKDQSLAVTNDGELYSWGDNGDGQLGLSIPTNTPRSSPVQVGSLTTWEKVFAGDGTSHAIKTTGALWGWGLATTNGSLGDGTRISKSSPVQIGALTDWQKLSSNGNKQHSLALKADNTLWAWGKNSVGELGLNDTSAKSSPVQIGSLTWSAISAADQHSTAVKSDGTLWSWGQGSVGRTGHNDEVDHSSPVQIGSETTWVSSVAGASHNLALNGVVG